MKRKIDGNRPFADLEKLMFGGVKWVDTRGHKGLRYQLFREGVDLGRLEEAYEVCLTHREPSLGVVVMIYELM